MSTMRVTNLKHENSASNNIVLNSDGSVGGDLATTLAEKLPYSYGTATPTTSDDGFLWYDSNSTPPTPKFWNGSSFDRFSGLTLVGTASTTGASSLTINNVFSSDFTNYRVWFNANLTAAELRIQTRAAGSNFTSDYYSSFVQYRTDSDAFIWNRENNSAYASTVTTSGILRGFIDFFSPNTTSGHFAGQVIDTSSGFAALFGCKLPTSIADGFRLVASTGTANFSAKIYGYQN